jgi:EXS family
MMRNLPSPKPIIEANSDSARFLDSVQRRAGLPSNNPKQRQKAEKKISKILWCLLIFALLIFTSLWVIIYYFVPKTYVLGLFICTTIWAAFLGAAAYCYLTDKAFNILFGGISGVSVSNIQSGDGLISSTNKIVQNISHEICLVFIQDSCNRDNRFITGMIWWFVIIIFLMCLPRVVSIEQKTI